MAKLKTIYICSNCEASFGKWSGACEECGEWNTLVEDVVEIGQMKEELSGKKDQLAGKIVVRKLHEANNVQKKLRLESELKEFDRVVGGGICNGSLMVLAGEPGIGKSTLVLQLLGSFKQLDQIVYIAGEESTVQIGQRAKRLSLNLENVDFWETNFLDVALQRLKKEKPDFVVIDSVSVMRLSDLDSAPGSLVQMRTIADLMMQFAKVNNIPVMLIGHVTKTGVMAGPRVFEHMVDTVLYLEGQRYEDIRLLRALKNRFGSTQEVGMFKMLETGLVEVEKPGAELLKNRETKVIGSALGVTLDGRRPFLVEVQALVNKSAFGNPKRSATGYDLNRLHMLIAVLEKYHEMPLSEYDIFVNVVGGVKIKEPGCDLAVMRAIASSRLGDSLPGSKIFIGEVGLDGKIRKPMLADMRKEAMEKLFKLN